MRAYGQVGGGLTPIPAHMVPFCHAQGNSKLTMNGKIAGIALCIMAAGGAWIERTVVETSSCLYMR